MARSGGGGVVTARERRLWLRVWWWRLRGVLPFGPVVVGAAWFLWQARTVQAQGALPSEWPVEWYRAGGTFAGIAIGVYFTIMVGRLFLDLFKMHGRRNGGPVENGMVRGRDPILAETREAIRTLATEFSHVGVIIRDRNTTLFSDMRSDMRETRKAIDRLTDEVRAGRLGKGK